MPSLNIQAQCGDGRKISVLEDQISSLRDSVKSLNYLSDVILNVICGDKLKCEESCQKTTEKTVAGNLNELNGINRGTQENLEEVLKVLKDQLGDLQLQ